MCGCNVHIHMCVHVSIHVFVSFVLSLLLTLSLSLCLCLSLSRSFTLSLFLFFSLSLSLSLSPSLSRFRFLHTLFLCIRGSMPMICSLVYDLAIQSIYCPKVYAWCAFIFCLENYVAVKDAILLVDVGTDWEHFVKTVLYGVATTSRLLKIVGLFCRISSLL